MNNYRAKKYDNNNDFRGGDRGWITSRKRGRIFTGDGRSEIFKVAGIMRKRGEACSMPHSLL